MSKRNSSTKYLIWLIAFIILLASGIMGKSYISGNLVANAENNNSNASTSAATVENSIEDLTENTIKIYYFDVGQADSILLTSNNQSMLIDAGTNDAADTVVQDIKNLGITKLDYVVGTHPHEDHIGGMDNVINTFDIGTIYMPKVQNNTKTFENVLDAVSNKGLKITTPDVGSTFDVGNINCEIMQCGVGTEAEQESDLNSSSIVIRATYGIQSYLFMGDATTKNEEARSWPQTNVLKVGHHGSDTSTSKSFLNQVKPQIAIISVGTGNTYGHPKQTTLDKLAEIGAKTYRTDESGTIKITSDGKINIISTEK